MKSSFIITLTLVRSAYTTCYNNTGNDFQNPDYIPCAASNLQTICCGLNRANPPGGYNPFNTNFTQDECLPNGICQNRIIDETQEPYISWWTSACTEKDFSKGKCLDVCVGKGSSPSRITPCDGTKNSTLWCCGGEPDCCKKPEAKVFEIAQVFGLQLPTSASASQHKSEQTATARLASPTSAPTLPSTSAQTPISASGLIAASSSTSMANSTSTARPGMTQHDPVTKAVIVGLGMGSALGGCAVVAAAVWLLKRVFRRQGKSSMRSHEVDGLPIAAGIQSKTSYGQWSSASSCSFIPLPDRGLVQELPASTQAIHIRRSSVAIAPAVELPATLSPRRWTFHRR